MIEYRINQDLANLKGLSDERVQAIEQVGKELMLVCTRPLHYGNHREVVRIVECMETTLQMLWGFPYSPKHHYYQLEISGCTCPKMDNMDMVGKTSNRLVNVNCPFHGVQEEDV